MNNLEEINAYVYAAELTEKYGIVMDRFSDRIRLKNKQGFLLGSFTSGRELLSYLLGYQSGILDYRLYEKEKDDE